MQGPQLFTISINDLDKGNEWTIAKLADNTRIGGRQVVKMTPRLVFSDLTPGWDSAVPLQRMESWLSAKFSILAGSCGRANEIRESRPKLLQRDIDRSAEWAKT